MVNFEWYRSFLAIYRAGTVSAAARSLGEYRMLYLVCRPNLDVYRGVSGQYNKRYGNLRTDGVDEVLGRALADGAYPRDEIWFSKEQLRPVRELAARYGDKESQRIHPSHSSLRHWWQDRARHTAAIL